MSLAPVVSAAVAPPPVVSGDIANYAYIWFNNSDPYKTITEKEKDFIHETITKGTFPTYLQQKYLQQKYSDDERQALFTNEIEFVRQKFTDTNLSHITILQMPRILYDLFNLFSFYNTQHGVRMKLDCETETETLEGYISYINETIEYFKDKIFELNDNIIHFLIQKNLLDQIISGNYNTILDSIMFDIKQISLKQRERPFGHIDTEKRITILRKVLEFESQPASNSILLYRGAKIKYDSTIEKKWDEATRERIQYPSSISLNLSILSGCILDKEACTFYYIDKPDPRDDNDNDKIKYTIKKFMFGDKSPEDLLFFIPPIPPYLQLYGDRELWHPRTKIGNDAPVMEGHPKGLYCNGIDFSKKFTYLQSDKTMEELEKMYQLYKGGNIETWRKYIKYKTKYLELKNRLGK
jgi:hypothetical protein